MPRMKANHSDSGRSVGPSIPAAKRASAMSERTSSAKLSALARSSGRSLDGSKY
jgi:hypothetical protein